MIMILLIFLTLHNAKRRRLQWKDSKYILTWVFALEGINFLNESCQTFISLHSSEAFFVNNSQSAKLFFNVWVSTQFFCTSVWNFCFLSGRSSKSGTNKTGCGARNPTQRPSASAWPSRESAELYIFLSKWMGYNAQNCFQRFSLISFRRKETSFCLSCHMFLHPNRKISVLFTFAEDLLVLSPKTFLTTCLTCMDLLKHSPHCHSLEQIWRMSHKQVNCSTALLWKIFLPFIRRAGLLCQRHAPQRQFIFPHIWMTLDISAIFAATLVERGCLSLPPAHLVVALVAVLLGEQ